MNLLDPFSADPTLNDTLHALDLATSPATGMSRKHILRDGKVVFTGNAGQVWKWLRSERMADD